MNFLFRAFFILPSLSTDTIIIKMYFGRVNYLFDIEFDFLLFYFYV